MLWSVDPEIEAARLLPDWKEFHKLCGQSSLYWDLPNRENKKRGPFTVIAFTLKKRMSGGYHSYELARATDKSLIGALRIAYAAAKRPSEITKAMLDRGLMGPGKSEPEAVADFAAELGGDDYEDLLG